MHNQSRTGSEPQLLQTLFLLATIGSIRKLTPQFKLPVRVLQIGPNGLVEILHAITSEQLDNDSSLASLSPHSQRHDLLGCERRFILYDVRVRFYWLVRIQFGNVDLTGFFEPLF